ncbi:MAG: hypothetical protein CMQ12_10205, partial [Gammaproteobacteria bacterium]|nr:hypothetical protein [Gammaproteobacteria bacterium]
AQLLRLQDGDANIKVWRMVFSYPMVPMVPMVPMGRARVRTQRSTRLTREDLAIVLRAFEKYYASVGETG